MKPVYYRMQIIDLIDKMEKDVLNALRMLRRAEDIANKETIRLSADDAETMQTAIIDALKILNTLETGLYEEY